MCFATGLRDSSPQHGAVAAHRGLAQRAELMAGLPFLQIDIVKQTDFDVMVESIFATDRRFRQKGMLEVMPWN